MKYYEKYNKQININIAYTGLHQQCYLLYVCSHYPECDAYVRVHTGTMAARKLRQLRNEAHKHFSKLIRDDYMTKQEAYQQLAVLLGAPRRETHIEYLSEYYCNIVIEESKKECARYLRKKRERKNFERSALAS